MYRGDYAPSGLVRFGFNTADATGAPITLAGTPTLRVYKDANTIEVATGVTLTVDYDARTGLHMVAVDLSSDTTFYAAGSTYQVVVNVGTVSGVSIAGQVIGMFTIGREVAALLDQADTIEVGVTLRGAFRLMLAALAGKLSGAGTTSVVFRNAVADSKARIVATVESTGNRTAITTDQT